jgi:geranylgeranyl pyrophosphate synthase
MVSLVENIIRELGIVFQIQDDLLELTSDSNKMGKTLGSDIIKQKKTFPYLYAKENLSAEKWIKFQEVTNQDVIEKHGIDPLRQLLEDNFIFDRIHELITLRHVTIHELIRELPERSHEMFNGMVEFIMNRKN